MNFQDQFIKTRSHSEFICKPLKTEDYVPQSAFFASPPKWHLAHTTWFFEEMILKKFDKGYNDFHPDFSFLFNSYYNTIGERTVRAERGLMTRPSVEEIYEYRSYVDKHMLEFLENTHNPEVDYLLLLGLNHEQQHQELLLTDLKYTLSLNPLFPVYNPDPQFEENTNEDHGLIKVNEGIYEIGHQGDNFCFDNELGRHKVYLHDFEIANSLVTNAEYLEFIQDGGYEKFEFWLDEGWAWVQENKVESPLYWHFIQGEWMQYTLAGLRRISPEHILTHINYYEASAFALWKGYRLPTEFEWEAANHLFNWGKRWEWTNSAYLPYPKFKTAQGAVGEYNGKFMVNQMVLRGSSTATSEGHSRPTYRNFFHPHFQWQFTGIRLAK